MAAGKWDDLPRGGGIYGIWSPDRSRLYVGETGNLANRLYAHRPSELLGCSIEVVAGLGEMVRSERRQVEDRLILALRTRGITVVNPTNAENHANHLRHSPEEYREYAARGLGKMTPAQRSAAGRKGAMALTTEQRRAARKFTSDECRINGKRGAEARWRKGAS